MLVKENRIATPFGQMSRVVKGQPEKVCEILDISEAGNLILPRYLV